MCISWSRKKNRTTETTVDPVVTSWIYYAYSRLVSEIIHRSHEADNEYVAIIPVTDKSLISVLN